MALGAIKLTTGTYEGTITADLSQIHAIEATLSGTGSLSLDLFSAQLITPNLPGEGFLNADVTVQSSSTVWQISGTLPGVGSTQIAFLNERAAITATAAGAASLTVNALPQVIVLSQTLAASGTTAVRALLREAVFASLPGVGSTVVDVTSVHAPVNYQISATLPGVAQLTATVTVYNPARVSVGGHYAPKAKRTRTYREERVEDTREQRARLRNQVESAAREFGILPPQIVQVLGEASTLSPTQVAQNPIEAINLVGVSDSLDALEQALGAAIQFAREQEDEELLLLG